jgi:hypothetical protein
MRALYYSCTFEIVEVFKARIALNANFMSFAYANAMGFIKNPLQR